MVPFYYLKRVNPPNLLFVACEEKLSKRYSENTNTGLLATYILLIILLLNHFWDATFQGIGRGHHVYSFHALQVLQWWSVFYQCQAQYNSACQAAWTHFLLWLCLPSKQIDLGWCMIEYITDGLCFIVKLLKWTLKPDGIYPLVISLI